jgi:hypothetical protein
MAVRPWRTLGMLAGDPAALKKGVLAILLVIAVYTVILGLFVAKDYPTAAPSALPLDPQEHYRIQIWYQGPLFFLTTALTAAVLVLIARVLGERADYSLAFARIAFVSVIPFFYTTMLVELVIALAVVLGILQPLTVLGWLTGAGSWFANGYQLVALVWMLVLFVMAARRTIGRGWLVSVPVGLLAMIVYAIPVALAIR